MKYILIFSFLINSTELIAQELKKINISNKEYKIKESYSVLELNPEIKQGIYNRSEGNLKIKGQYNNNLRVGIWEYFFKGEVQQKIDFTRDTIIYSKPFSLGKTYLATDSEKEIAPDRAPIFLSGSNSMYNLIGERLRYPAQSRRMGIEGNVWISIIISKEGKMIDEIVQKGVSDDIDQEALRVIKTLPKDWYPGLFKGVRRDMRIVFPVMFKLG
jgi:periplasmic protein TonB